MRVLRWWPYLVLVLALVGCLVGFTLLPLPLEGWRGFALNLATEIVGILLTVLLIDAVLRRREDRARDRYRTVALRQLWAPLNRQCDLFSSIYKASSERRPEQEISGVTDLFDEDYFRQIERLDITAASGTARSIGDDPMPWYECIGNEMKGFKEDLERVVDKYAMYLDIDTVDAVERLIGSNFVNIMAFATPTIVSHFRSMGHQGPIPLLFAAHDVDDPVREYTDALSQLVKIYDETAPNDRKVRTSDSTWRDDILPKVGSARIPDELMQDERGG